MNQNKRIQFINIEEENTLLKLMNDQQTDGSFFIKRHWKPQQPHNFRTDKLNKNFFISLFHNGLTFYK